jgi:hypothetical protein
MTKNQIEHMWKVASNNPNHDSNWHDPVVVAFAELVAKHTLANIDPSSFMSWQEGYEAGKQAEREACAKVVDAAKAGEEDWDSNDWNQAVEFCASRIRARGQA